MAGTSTEREPLLASGAASGVQPSNGPLVVPTAETDHGTFSSDDRLPDSSSSSADAERQDDEDVDEARRRQYEGNLEARKQLKYILPAVGVGVWLGAADSTIVVSAYGAIGSDLHELNKTAWIAQSYFLTLTSFQPLCGKLSDIFGRKTILLFSYFIFGIGCLWCGLAQSMDSLIAARALAGIGGGGMNTVVSILISDIVPLNERGMWQGIINIIWAVGSGMGAPLGGILADSIGWRIAFIAQAPVCLLAFISCYFALQIKRPEEEAEDEQNGGNHWTSKLRRIDFLGALTLILAVTLLLVGLDRGSNVAWSDTATITTLAVCIPMLVAFVYVETRVAAEPFAPGRVIFGRSMIGAFGCNFFCVMGWYSVMFYVPLYLQGVKQMTATAAGVRLLPALIFTVIGSLSGGIIMRKTGRYYALNLAGFGTLVLACVVLTLSAGPPLRSVPGIMVALALGGLGGGSGVTTSLIALIANADPADQAVATACSYLFRSLGSVLGLSFVSSLLQLQLRDKLMDRLDGGHGGRAAQEIVERVRQSLSAIDKLPANTAEIVRATYGESIRECFGVIVIFVFFAFFSALFVREKRLNK